MAINGTETDNDDENDDDIANLVVDQSLEQRPRRHVDIHRHEMFRGDRFCKPPHQNLRKNAKVFFLTQKTPKRELDFCFAFKLKEI